MIARVINGLEIEVDEKSANEVYFPESFIDSIESFDGNIETLKENIYKWNGNTSYMPLSILWELTNRCNFKCPFCYINTESAPRYPYIGFDECKKIIDTLVEKGMLFCCLSGGECLLHPEFMKIYKYLKQKGVLVTIFTNGSLLNKEIVQLFQEYRPYKVEISIYGLSERIFKNTTSSTDMWKAENILNAIEELNAKGINIRCKSPITTLNVCEILEIKRWCNARNIDYYTSEEILPSNEGESREMFAVKGETLKEIKKKNESFFEKRQDDKYDYKKAWDCSAGKYAGIIGSDRNFYPCLSAVGVKKFTYSMRKGIANAIENHKKQVMEEAGNKLFFCKGCKKCNICEKCILSSYTDSKEENQTYCENRRKNI